MILLIVDGRIVWAVEIYPEEIKYRKYGEEFVGNEGESDNEGE